MIGWLTALPMYAQISGNDYPFGCSTISFVYACNGQPATALQGEIVRFTCSEQGSEIRQIDENGNVYFKSPLRCRSRINGMCITDSNWKICSKVGPCTYAVELTMEVEPFFNETSIGLGTGTGYTNTSCYGRLYNEVINNLNAIDDLVVCPGDDVVLTFPYADNFEIPTNSGMCLFMEADGPQTAAPVSKTYTAADVSNGEVNVTDFFDEFELGEVYYVSMWFGCCLDAASGQECFDMASRRSFYIRVVGQFDYGLRGIASDGLFGGGNSQNFLPSETPHGPTLDASMQNVTLFGFDVVNPNNVDITYQVFLTGCDEIANNDIPLGQPIAVDVIGSTFGFGGILVPLSTNDPCRCYRVDITYDNNCGEALTTDTYYFKHGNSCPEFSFFENGLDDVKFNDENLFFDLVQNPVGDNLMLQWSTSVSEIFEITVFDVNGTPVLQQEIDGASTQASIPFRFSAGTYFYQVVTDTDRHTGKLIKQ